MDMACISGDDLNTVTANTNAWITGLIEIEKGDIVRISNYYDKASYGIPENMWLYRISFYNADGTFNRLIFLNDFLSQSNYTNSGFTWSDNGDTLEFTFDGTSSLYSSAKYFRLSSCNFPDGGYRLESIANSIATVKKQQIRTC